MFLCKSSEMMLLLLYLISLGVSGEAIHLNYSYDCPYCQPEQVHIAFGEKSNDIVVTWSTFNDTEESRVEYGVSVMDQQASGDRNLFVDGGPLRRRQWIHTVTLRDLHYDTKYMYHCGSVYGWSEQFWFHVPPEGESWVLRAAIYGDMGNKNAHSMSYLQEESQRDKFDLILHVGDFAYDMDSEDATVGDQFMRQIQPLAALVPYMTCPGNHEEKYNFSNYRHRFNMPVPSEQRDAMYYSFDLGPVHFVSVSTEYYYFINYGFKMIINQYEWLMRDLEQANLPENRARRPWIVIFGHRPMYCANDEDECKNEYIPVRCGLPLFGLGLEPLLQQYAVDVAIWAHEHSYERTWPLYDQRVYNGSYTHPYVNPKAPVHVVTGSAGCQEKTDKFVRHPPAWSAFRSSDYGYTRLRVQNGTHLYMEQVDVEEGGKVIDSFWLVKDQPC